MDLLNKLYYDERTGLQSANKLYDKAKVIDNKITITEVSGQSIYLDDLKKPYRPFQFIIANTKVEDNAKKKDNQQMVFERKMRREGLDFGIMPRSVSNNPYPILE